jgi:hypothetical protein
MAPPKTSVDYPANFAKFASWFTTDADCLDYLSWLRWPNGFECPRCGGGGWLLGDGRYECSLFSSRTFITAGTIVDSTRTPLSVWFHACWLFASERDGVSALALQGKLELHSYQTSWAMLARLRSLLVRPGRELLSGDVEVDETFVGGHTSGQ